MVVHQNLAIFELLYLLRYNVITLLTSNINEDVPSLLPHDCYSYSMVKFNFFSDCYAFFDKQGKKLRVWKCLFKAGERRTESREM